MSRTRHIGLIAVCACIVVSVGCDGVSPHAPSPVSDLNATITVEFSGRLVNVDTGAPVENVRLSLGAFSTSTTPAGWVFPTNSAMSGGDGTFTLPLNVPRGWTLVELRLAGPGYDERSWRFERNMPGTHAEIRMYPTLVVRPRESIEVRVESTITLCGYFSPLSCRRVLVEASPGEAVELEIVPHDTSQPMGLAANDLEEETVPRLKVAPGGVAYVHACATCSGTLTARR